MNLSRKRGSRASWLIALSLIVNCDVFSIAQNKHRVALPDLQTLKTFEYLLLSPDGGMVAYVLDGEIWLIACKPGSVPRKLGKGSVPLWSPDGKRIAYYAKVSDTLQLFVFDLNSGHSKQLTHLNGGVNPDPSTRIVGFYYDPMIYSWSPDGTKLVFASQVIRHERDTGIDRTSPKNAPKGSASGGPLVLNTKSPPEWTLRGVFAHGRSLVSHADGPPSMPSAMVNQLFLVDIHEKIVRQLTRDDALYFNPDWSPDGKNIICASSEGRSLAGLGAEATNIYSVDVLTGAKLAVTTGPGDKRLPRWSPDGHWIAYLGGEHLGTQSVFVIPAEGGRPFSVTSELDRSVAEFYWPAGSRSIVVSYQNGVSSVIARVDIATGVVRNVAPGYPAYIWPISAARSGTLAWSQSDAFGRGVIRILPGGASSSYVLLDLNPQIKEWELGTQETVRWGNSGGDQLEGIIIKPVGYREGNKYPLIVDCYPETVSGFMGSAMGGNQLLASEGYVVFYPNARAPHVWMNPFKTTAYDFAARGPNGWDITVDDVMSGVDELVRRGVVDPDRMGLFGFSNGGGIVDYLVTRTGRFKCAVSVAAVLPDWSRPALLEAATSMISTVAGVTPWQNPEGYVKLSAVYYLDNVKTPMLLAVGDDDTHFLLNMIEMYNGLRWLGKDVTFLRYPKQGHGLTGAALEDFWRRLNAFFDQTLRSKRLNN